VLAAEHLLHLGLIDLDFERVQRPLEIGDDILALRGPLEQNA
jgi:hypothetical protein